MSAGITFNFKLNIMKISAEFNLQMQQNSD